MAKFCGFCGAPNEGGLFCTSCGQRFPVSEGAAPPSAPPAQPVAQDPDAGHDDTAVFGSVAPPGPGQSQPSWRQPPPQQTWGAAPYGSQRQLANPFEGVPVTDYLRDAVALVALFVSLGLPWDAREETGGRWWAVISVLVLVAAVALPYLGKARLVPGWGPREIRVVKLLALVPLGASVLAAVVNELVNIDDFSEGGLGSGLALAVGGGLLAVQPRAADEDPGHREDTRWWAATRVAAVVALLLAVATWLAYLVDGLANDEPFFDDVLVLLITLVELLIGLALLGIPTALLLRGSPVGRRLLVTLGLMLLAAIILGSSDDGEALLVFREFEKWNTPLAGTFMFAAAAALAASRPARRRTARRDEVGGWVATAAQALMLAAILLVLLGIQQVLVVVWYEEASATTIIPIVLTFVGAASALLGRSLLPGLPASRARAVGLAAGLVVLGIIAVTVTNESPYLVTSGEALAPWFFLPGLALYSLVVPSTVRGAFGPLLQEREPQQYPSQYPGQQPGQQQVGPDPDQPQAGHPQQPDPGQQPGGAAAPHEWTYSRPAAAPAPDPHQGWQPGQEPATPPESQGGATSTGDVTEPRRDDD
jgi:hypothetical protein